MTDDEDPSVRPILIDKVRASKAGHAFHEAWAARTALELLLPATDLTAITLEGFDEKDEQELGTGAVEIADLVQYYGGTDVARSRRVTVIQFKYSIASADTAVRAADIASTLTKFATTDAELRTKHGDEHIAKVVRYEFATNRPIHSNLGTAIAAVINGIDPDGDVGRQAGQITQALKNYPYPAAELLPRLALVGSKGSLIDAERAISATLAAWSEPSDPDAEKRLLKLRNLIRIKAGPGSETDKRIDRVAVLAELEVEHEDRLYPTPDAFPGLEDVIQRSVLDDITNLARQAGSPLIVHAAGGMGKTVLMQGIAERLQADGPAVLFDGFGAGRWRDPADGRHLPERTLVHLANLLSGQGLCDILLPVADMTGLLKAFRRRLTQAVATARTVDSDACVSLVLDAIDHAGLAAQETGTSSFAHLLLRSLSVDPIDGIRIVASCRTERLTLATGDSAHRSFAVPLFTDTEARTLIARRVPDASAAEVAALLMRSGRNPRCLDSLIAAGRPFDPVFFPDTPAEPHDLLDSLLRKRLEDARNTAISRGAKNADIDLLLTGIALLAPPVPIDELAAAHGLIAEQVESFAADLAPLLERTPHGLMFRDEPTETLIRSSYGTSQAGRDRVIAALQERQLISNYAARALPALLTSLRNADQLIRLAYDLRVPVGASQVSARDIRLARITAAIALAGELGRRDDLLRLLLEASVVAAGHERSDRFLYEHPDVAAVAGDPEALRRLAATNVGWPGGKHARLALANVFAGDRDEARRHARRSIDWHNWAARPKNGSQFNESKSSRQWDDIGFAYVEMLAGNDIRVAEFFSRQDAGLAFDKFHDLFDLLERHQCSAHPPATRVATRLLRCRLPSRGLFAAALQFAGGGPAHARRLITALSAAPPATDKNQGLAMASVLAAARAIDLSLEQEGTAILDGAALKTQAIYNYSSYFPIDSSVDVTALAAGVRAALQRKPVALIDIVPAELMALVPASARSRGAAVFLRTLTQKLAAPKYDGTWRRRKRRDGLDEQTRSDYSRALSNRIMPLLEYAQDAANIIRPPRGTTRTAMLGAAFDRLVSDVDKSSNYPYRDAKAYIARIGFRIIFHLADALGALDAAFATRIAEWLAAAPGLFTPELTDVVTRLSRIPQCHNAAMLLADHVERRIQLDTDVESRITAYGSLARAVWRVSVDEAAAYFRRALDLAEAIGSDDFDRTNHLLELAGHYSGPELAPQASHTLARILELNQNEDGRFPWIEYAKAMVPVAGRATLANLARLDDRDAASLGYSLGPALTVLLRNSKLSVQAAVALFGLAAPTETWTWHISSFASEAVGRLPQGQREWFFNLLLVEIDRNDQLSPAQETIEGLHRLAENYLPVTSPARMRIAGLLARRGQKSEQRSTILAAITAEPLAVFPIDLGDPDEIDRQILNREIDHTGRPWPVRTLLELAKQATSPVDRLAFVRAVVEATAATLADKIHALDDHLEDWSKSSAAMRDALPELGLRLASKHANELASSSTDAWGGWQGLEQYFHANPAALVEHVVAGLRSSTDSLGGNAWLSLAARLAAETSDSALVEGLERFLANTGEKLPAEVGDGPWDARFAVVDDEATVVTGLVWARLGHPVAAMRWRAAHAVRRLAEVGSFDVIGSLIDRFHSSAGMPFSDAKLPFYTMHAQLWLLIALSRVAKESADVLSSRRAFFERIAFSTDFPHVAMRAFAIDILREIAETLASGERDALIAQLELANVSPYPHAPRADYTQYRYATRPDSSPQPNDAFHLDYDFDKYHVESLCHVFGCPGWEVDDQISARVRRWDATVRSMHDCARTSGYSQSWSSAYLPDRDLYGGYLAWHGLMLVAGDLLAARTVVGEDWSGDAWAAFLKDYRLSRKDNFWLADLTDLFPLDLTTEADMPMPESGGSESAREDSRRLSPLLGLDGGKVVADWIPVAGRWSIGRDTTVNVCSVLANASDAQSTAMALLSDQPFFRWLPDSDDEVSRNFGPDGHTVQPWVAETPNTERRLDRHDPYGASTALDRPFPTDSTVALMKAHPDDPAVRRWLAGTTTAFRAEAWGAEGGKGEYAWSESGSRLYVNGKSLLSLLEATERSLVVTVKLQKYHKGKSTGRAGDTSGFTHRSLIAIVNGRGEVRTPLRISKQAKHALEALDADRRRDFYPRFRAIAGLPDEWLARRNDPPLDIEEIQIFLESLSNN
ncbi:MULTISPECIES: ATP-binding protein [unclassified Neorhizobium]|uniref:ATP-binding protein n=1 Tax=unclassified Neorhizobium TaxID=2629175 RepID=UPI001FF0FD12|nr:MULTISPECIES: ATP-binding protein [unclassified Neorhizobium]MCJ9668522.1 ATP-binding protein [Neorhizobium sp. SHOUNA12B]MCJ9744225.1 ATP-binding protein [Neorhizobium sp. SHOUNA12A]